jgi:hypothetical protein
MANDHAPAAPAPDLTRLARRHLRAGWLGLLVFALLGIALEALHAWKNPAYLGVDNETRRLMWTLAHAHGVGLSLVQIAFAATLRALSSERLVLSSRLLNVAWALIPLGFFLGGVTTYEADPGFGILLVPIGALALVFGLGTLVLQLFKN